jgi:hypothetical protein
MFEPNHASSVLPARLRRAGYPRQALLGYGHLRRCGMLASLMALLACTKSDASTKPDASAVIEPSAAAPVCGGRLERGFSDPQQAYAAYAEAINAGNWCDAIHAFAPAQRAEVAIANFKVLAMLAGADNPKRPAHEARFAAFCRHHRLDCGSAESATQLAQHIMLRLPLDAELAAVQALAARSAEDTYVELMRGQAEADAAALSKFEVPLREIHVDGQRATGSAAQASGSVSTLPFVRTQAGWQLAFR